MNKRTIARIIVWICYCFFITLPIAGIVCLFICSRSPDQIAPLWMGLLIIVASLELIILLTWLVGWAFTYKD